MVLPLRKIRTMNNERISFVITRELLGALRQSAEKNDRNLSQEIRRALKQYLAQPESQKNKLGKP